MFHALDFTHDGDTSRFPAFPVNCVISGQAYRRVRKQLLQWPSWSVVAAGLAVYAVLLLMLDMHAIPIWLAMLFATIGILAYLGFALDDEDAEIENVTPIGRDQGCIDPANIERLMAVLMRHRLGGRRRDLTPLVTEGDLQYAGIIRHEIGFDQGRLTHSIVSQHPGSRRDTRLEVSRDRQLSDLALKIFGDDLNRVSVYTGGTFDGQSAAAR